MYEKRYRASNACVERSRPAGSGGQAEWRRNREVRALILAGQKTSPPHGPHTGRTERRRSRGHSRAKKYKTRDPTRGPRSSAVRLGTAILFADTPREYGNGLCPTRASAECKICNALCSVCLPLPSSVRSREVVSRDLDKGRTVLLSSKGEKEREGKLTNGESHVYESYSFR